MDPQALEELKKDFADYATEALASKLNLTPDEAEESSKIIGRAFDFILSQYL